MNGEKFFAKILSEFSEFEEKNGLNKKQKQTFDKSYTCYCIVCRKNFLSKNRWDLFCSDFCFNNSKI